STTSSQHLVQASTTESQERPNRSASSLKPKNQTFFGYSEAQLDSRLCFPQSQRRSWRGPSGKWLGLPEQFPAGPQTDHSLDQRPAIDEWMALGGLHPPARFVHPALSKYLSTGYLSLMTFRPQRQRL